MTARGDEDAFLAFTPVPGVASPCIGICRIGDDDVCEGCHRSLDEIGWLAHMLEHAQAGWGEHIHEHDHGGNPVAGAVQ